MKKTVYLPVEVFVREFEAKMYFAVELANAGYRVIIGRITEVFEAAKYVGDDGIYIINSLQNATSELIDKSFNTDSIKVFSWDEEGVCIERDERFLAYRVSKKSIKDVDGIICWGPHEKKLIERCDSSVDEKIFVVGNPRLDILGDNTKILYKKEISELRQRYGDYILVVSNGICYDLDSLIKNVERLRGNRFSEEEIEEWKELDKYKYKTNIEKVKWIKEYTKKRDITVIIRPHPRDCIEYWEELFEGYDNIVVTKEYNINVWLGGAKLLVHDGCTTALEAYLSKVPSILCRPYDEDFFRCFPTELSVEVKTYDEFSYYLDTSLKNELGDFFDDKKNNYLAEYISINEKSSSKRIVEIFKSKYGTECKKHHCYIKWIPIKIKWHMRNIYHSLKKYSNYKWPLQLNKELMRETLDNIMLLKGIEDITYKRIGKNIYEIKKD